MKQELATQINMAALLNAAGLSEEQVANYNNDNAEDRIFAATKLLEALNNLLIKITLGGIYADAIAARCLKEEKEVDKKVIELLAVFEYAPSIGTIVSAALVLLEGDFQKDISQHLTISLNKLSDLSDTSNPKEQ